MIADCAFNKATVMSSNGNDTAAANPSCGGNWNKLQILVVIVSMPAGSARIAGVPNSVIDCRNAIRNPASSAGTTSGSVISRAVRHAGEHVGKGVQGHDEHHAAGGKDVDQRRGFERFQAEQRVVPLVDQPG